MTTSYHCCSNCFDDTFLEQNYFANESLNKGECSFCGSSEVRITEPSELINYFSELADAYESSASGRSLLECLKEDWGFFRKINLPSAETLLGRILDDLKRPMGLVIRGQNEEDD